MIEVTYSPSLADYQALSHHVVWKKMRKMAVLLGFVFVLSLLAPLLAFTVAGASLHGAGLEVGKLLIFPGVIVAFAVFTWVLTQRAIKARWKQAGELREEKRYIFDESGVRVEAKSFQGTMEWSHFTQVEFWRGFVYLMNAQGHFHYFPLAGASDQAGLVALLRRKVRGG